MMIFGLLFIVFGALSLSTPFLTSLIKLQNTLMGVKTKITPATITYHRMMAILWIIIGIFLVLGGINNSFGKQYNPYPFASADIKIQHFDKPIK